MGKTIFYYSSRGDGKRLTALIKINELLKLGYNIVVVPPEQGKRSVGKRANIMWINDQLYDFNDYTNCSSNDDL